ncbi:hypothetical protein CBW46_015785 [Paenibacillus xerothermodurans]|uniref:Phosphodiester glycosidase domain-containing protein n=2 Tax=Paenibacillus xerothermodurans TaxID=1977292 RepID=A0A2W1NQI7_PAEXE|nr:hypothetical protein CBW46_015785 [Paenibacillus xerothermodurans]
MASSFLFMTPPGTDIRLWLAHSVIITQHREWAWIFVGAAQRDELVRKMHLEVEENAQEKQDMGLITHKQHERERSIDELIKVEDISGKLWKGKKMYVFDPTSIRVMTPSKPGEGERITSMVKRTGAVAGVNGGGFGDPEGLGNGFAALGAIISGGEIIFTDQDGSIKQHIVGFTKDGTLVIGKYDMFELRDMGISEAASFYPRVIANGKPLPITDPSRAPRTAVGQKADGTVIFIIIDGRQAHSVGATLKEVQTLFLQEGAVNAGFLDGGASSEMVVGGELITKPSSRYGERRLPSAFLVYDRPEEVRALRVWDGIDKIDAGGAHDHPEFLQEQAEKKTKQKNNPTTPGKRETTAPDGPAVPSTGSSATKPAVTNKSSAETNKKESTAPKTVPTDASEEKSSTDAATQAPSGSKTVPAKPDGDDTTQNNDMKANTKPNAPLPGAPSTSSANIQDGGSPTSGGSTVQMRDTSTPAAPKQAAPLTPGTPAAPTVPAAPGSVGN